MIWHVQLGFFNFIISLFVMFSCAGWTYEEKSRATLRKVWSEHSIRKWKRKKKNEGFCFWRPVSVPTLHYGLDHTSYLWYFKYNFWVLLLLLKLVYINCDLMHCHCRNWNSNSAYEPIYIQHCQQYQWMRKVLFIVPWIRQVRWTIAQCLHGSWWCILDISFFI
jgi:hypothetical protein